MEKYTRNAQREAEILKDEKGKRTGGNDAPQLSIGGLAVAKIFNNIQYDRMFQVEVTMFTDGACPGPGATFPAQDIRLEDGHKCGCARIPREPSQ